MEKLRPISIILGLITLLIFTSCQSSVRFSSEKVDSRANIKFEKAEIITENLDNKQKIILEESEKYIGTPYCYGGLGLNCFDCSGLVQLIFQKVGIKLPRSAEDQWTFSSLISKSEVKPGDLVFFRTGKKISHVGIYIGNNKFIHSSSSNGVVVQSLEEKYYKEHFASFGRVLN